MDGVGLVRNSGTELFLYSYLLLVPRITVVLGSLNSLQFFECLRQLCAK